MRRRWGEQGEDAGSVRAAVPSLLRAAALALGAVLTAGQAAAQEPVRYGRTDLFEVSYRYETNVCAASRVILIEDEVGSGGSYYGAFSFGAVQVGDTIYGLVSIVDPDIAMEYGQEALGAITIDGSSYDAYLAADDVDILTAYVDFGLLERIAYGGDVAIESPNLTYTLPLDGTLRAYRILEICFEERFPGSGIAAPSDDSYDSGGKSSKKKKSKPNPLQ